MKRVLAGVLLWLLLFPGLAAGADDKPPESKPPPPPLFDAVTTQHGLPVGGRRLEYTATIESLPVSDGKGATAQVVVIAYQAKDQPVERRPVTFVFNGGPGASSAYLQMAAMGPRIVAFPDDGSVPPPPVTLIDNPDSWLVFTDLVFIDPVGAGFAPAELDEDRTKPFWSVGGDAASLSELITLWVNRNGRGASPKLLAGESYGGYRAALIADTLQEQQGIALNGLIMISPALDFSLIGSGGADVLPWALSLPSMAAAAQVHGKGEIGLSPDEVERFALTDYLTGIAAIAPAGPGPDPALIDRVAAILGLDRELVRRHHGRVPAWAFAERLLDGSGRALSLYDAGLAMPDPQPGRQGPDPLLQGSIAPLSSAYQLHVRTALGLRTDLPFRLLARRPGRHWDWQGARGGPGPEDAATDDLAAALAHTPKLRLLVVHGRTDLVTPYMASRWLLDRLDLPEAVRQRICFEVLDGGHMMYFHPSQRTELTRLAAEFYRVAAH